MNHMEAHFSQLKKEKNESMRLSLLKKKIPLVNNNYDIKSQSYDLKRSD